MHYTQIQVYVIRWRPSQCSVDPTEEIILDNDDPKHFIGKVLFIIRNMCQYHIIIVSQFSELSGVPVKYISFSKVNH